MKDVLDLTDPDEFLAPIPAKRLRRLESVPRDADLEDALAVLRRRGAHVAKSLDAEGRTVGLLYLEDVIEILVGEIDATVQST